MPPHFATALLGLLIATNPPAAPASPFTPTSDYHPERIEGFTVLIHPDVLEHEADANRMREELSSQLKAIARVLPADALTALKRVRFWVEWEKKPKGAAEYHPSAAWLKDNGYNPEKAGDVELNNARNFVTWSRTGQPWMVLHELAHAHHHRVLGDHQGIERAFAKAVDGKRYESVAHVAGRKERAYALSNSREYFAELSEAYFGRNDFYPFTRDDLKAHDPEGYRVVAESWGDPRPADD